MIFSETIPLIITVISALGGFTFIQWAFNRRYEKRLNKVNSNTAQFDLFTKMDEYLSKKFDTFSKGETYTIEAIERLEKDVMFLKDGHSQTLEDFKYTHQGLLRMQLLHFLQHLPENGKVIEKLYNEYHNKYNGNSYIDDLVRANKKKYRKPTPKKQTTDTKKDTKITK